MTTLLAWLVAIVALLPLLNYVLRRHQNPFHPLVFVGATSFFVTAWGVLTDHQRALIHVTNDMLTVFLLAVLLSLLGFYFGWWFHTSRHGRPEPSSTPLRHYRPEMIISWALLLTIIGVSTDWVTLRSYATTGYLRDLGLLWIAGAILAVQAAALNPRLTLPAGLIVAACISAPIERFISYGQRGDTFRMAVLAVPLVMARNWRPRRLVFIPAAVLLALVLAVLAQTRPIVNAGDARGRLDALVQAIPRFFQLDKTKRLDPGTEFVFGSAMVDTVRREGAYECGAFVYNLGVRFLPKELFDKQVLYTPFSTFNRNVHVAESSGVHIPPGAAPTGFASLFVEFGWFCPVFWAFVGFLVRAWYIRATARFDVAAQGYLTAFLIITLFLITQDLDAGAMNAIYTLPAMWLIYRWSRIAEPQGFPVLVDQAPEVTLADTPR